MKQTASWFKISTEVGLEVGTSEIWCRNKHLHPDQALKP